MELDELKQKWNKLDGRLSKSEVYSERALRETIKTKSETTYDYFRKREIMYAVAAICIAIVTTNLWLHERIHQATFYVFTSILVAGLFFYIYRYIVASRFSVNEPTSKQLQNVVWFHKCVVIECWVAIPIAIIAFGTLFFCEWHCQMNATRWFAALSLIPIGTVACILMWRKHKKTIDEIKKNLAELKEFES